MLDGDVMASIPTVDIVLNHFDLVGGETVFRSECGAGNINDTSITSAKMKKLLQVAITLSVLCW
jgi:hypothetical protein